MKNACNYFRKIRISSFLQHIQHVRILCVQILCFICHNHKGILKYVLSFHIWSRIKNIDAGGLWILYGMLISCYCRIKSSSGYNSEACLGKSFLVWEVCKVCSLSMLVIDLTWIKISFVTSYVLSILIFYPVEYKKVGPITIINVRFSQFRNCKSWWYPEFISNKNLVTSLNFLFNVSTYN